MRLTVFVLGPAGSGKTTFVASFSQWAYNESIPVLTLNLDPAAEDLPYIPDIDIREYLTAREVMERYELGPNGAIVASMDLILNYVEKLRSGVEDEEEGYVVVDTPGQMEVFAFRHGGEHVIKELCTDKCVVIFLIDALLSTSPSNFISQVFLATSIFYKLRLPQLNLLNKADLLSQKDKERIGEWSRNIDRIGEDLEIEAQGIERILTRNILMAIKDFLDFSSISIVSSKTMEGFENVYLELQKLYKGGEDFELPEHLREF